MVTLIKKCLRLIPTKAVSGIFYDSFVIPLLLVFFLISNTSNAQVSVYGFSQSLTGYTPLSGTPTTAFATGWTDGVTAATIPFTFHFNGAAYTSCRISCNGFITFGPNPPIAATVTPLSTPTSATYLGAASVMGADWSSNGSPIVYGTEGVAPNRVFVVQWTNAVRALAPTGNFNFQIRLHETTDVIEYSYGACSTTSTTPVGMQVGLRGPDNVMASGNVINRSMAADVVWFNNTTAGTVNNAFIRTVNLAYPDLGLSYKWTPAPLCTTPTAQPTALNLTSVTHNSLNGSFTAASPAPTGYLVLRSTTNVAPTAAQVPNGTFPTVGGTMGAAYTVVSFSNTTSFTQTGLSPNTTYYYWVISYNSGCTGAPNFNLTGILNNNTTTCSTPTVATAASGITGNDFVANWNLVAGATDYTIDVATDAGFASILPAYNNLSVGNVSSHTITGLTSLTAYYYRVRAIGASCPINSNVIGPVNTICGFFTVTYTQNFDAVALGAIPGCYTRIDSNADSVQWGVQNTTSASSPKSIFIGKNITQPMDDWFFLPGLNLTAGVSYRLFFRYNTGSSSGTTENLKAMLGTTPTVPAMTQTLVSLTNINNTLFKSVYVDFTPVINDVYYIGFQGYSVANQSYIAVDDISVTLSPTCFEPTAVTVSAITSTTATVSWTPPMTDPSGGYQYYISSSPTPPTAGSPVTGSVGPGVYTAALGPLLSSTTYYIWVRGNCGPTDKSVWSLEETFSTECITPVVLSTTPATRCGVGTATLTATPNTGSSINWYATSVGGTPVYTGNSFTTPTISSTTTYYAEAKAFGAIAKVGPTSPTTHTGIIGIQNFQSSVNFNVLDDTTFQSIDIFPIASGQAGQLVIRNSSNINIGVAIPFTTTVSGGNVAQTIPIGRALPPGSYNLYLAILPASGLSMNTTNTFYPYTSSAAEITGNPIDNTQYLGFYNWKFTTQCLSGRVAVAATVTPPPALGISSPTSVICENSSSPVITLTGYAAYDTFQWTPAGGVSGTASGGYTFNPTTSTVYTLVASQSTGSQCSNVVTHTVTVNPIPPAVTVIPASAITICENTIQALNGSVGTFSSVPIFTENFNSATNGWTIANTSTDGDVLASQWAQRPSPYNYTSSTWNVSLNSNDNTPFYFSNADSQGSSLLPFVVTHTTLRSPAFSLVGYTSATLNFFHYLRYIGGDTFLVEVSTNNGGSWTTVRQFTSTQGTPTAFVNATVDLSPYLGNNAVLLRFNFNSNWGYGWAVDNIAITGTVATALTWSPATGLYSDSAATVPYVLNTPLAVVYAKPTTTTVYSATATGANSCESSGTITINVDALPVGGTLSADQILCNATPASNIILSGHSGNVVRWEYANDAAFTLGVTAIANTTTTLTPAQMGVFTTIRYFRAVVSRGVCPPVYSTVSFVSYPVTTWTGSWSNGVPTAGMKAIFAGNYTAAADLHACSVTVQSGTVTFAPGTNLIVENEVTVTGGSLVFENTSSLVQYNSTVANTGNILYKRNTTGLLKYDYTYWSSPVAGQSLTAFSPNTNSTKFYEFNPTTNLWTFYNGIMQPGKGYIVRAPDVAPFNTSTTNVWNAAFTGVPNNGTITTPVLLSTSDLNLLGNPYPSALSADLFLLDTDNAGKFDGTLYFWTHNTPLNGTFLYTSNDYASYNLVGGVGTGLPATNGGINPSTPNGHIASGVAFFARATQNGNATFKNSMRLLSQNNQFFRMSGELNTPSAIEKDRLWLNVTNDQGAYKQTLVGYVDGATYGVDWGFDGSFFDGGNVVGLYSLIGADKYAIQGRPTAFDSEDQVPIGFKSTIGSTFKIALEQFDDFFADVPVYLEDKLLGIIHNLKESPYTFTTDAGTFDTRFVLRYTNGTLSNPHFDTANLVIYKNENWIINSGTVDMQSVKVFDIRGRLLFENKSVSGNQTVFNVGDVSQVLLVQVTSVDGLTVTKKVVN